MEGVSEGVAKTSRRATCKRSIEYSTNRGKYPSVKRRRFTDRRNSSIKPRLGGSLSDPLNLEVWSDDNECSTYALSPADKSRNLGDQSHVPLPQELHHDPLNLGEKINDFETLVGSFNQILPVNKQCFVNKDKRKKKRFNRRKSRSESSNSISGDCNNAQLNHTSSSSSSEKSFNPKAALYRYGNYDRYYSYRNNGLLKDDPRLAMFCRDWFNGCKCLDIGSNTGQVTIEIGRLFAPTMITGIDIDLKLVRTASKNLHKFIVPDKMPDGRVIPQSILQSFGPINWLNKAPSGNNGFPNNVEFVQGNYVPLSEGSLERTRPEYDVILCLSVTKWIHLNWGDDALKRMFQKMHRNLRPNGRLILEPQPWSSYARRRKLTPEISNNYQNIRFRPDQFHDYLMSSEVGFTKHQYMGVANNKNPGFQRDLHMYIKEETQSITADQPPCSSDDNKTLVSKASCPRANSDVKLSGPSCEGFDEKKLQEP